VAEAFDALRGGRENNEPLLFSLTTGISRMGALKNLRAPPKILV
jgi:hypothetical protein